MKRARERKWNPRYIAYCKVHAKSPTSMLEHDEIKWPGGRMCGFMLWLGGRWREFARQKKAIFSAPFVHQNGAEFDRWLERVENLTTMESLHAASEG